MREPGTQFNYSSGESALLAHVFRATRDIEEYAATYLFAPLGITRWFWKRPDRARRHRRRALSRCAGSGAHLVALPAGRAWQGRRMVIRGLGQGVGHARHRHHRPGAQYGYKWWLQPRREGRPAHLDRLGFWRTVPDHLSRSRLVVVFTAWNILGGGANAPSRDRPDACGGPAVAQDLFRRFADKIAVERTCGIRSSTATHADRMKSRFRRIVHLAAYIAPGRCGCGRNTDSASVSTISPRLRSTRGDSGAFRGLLRTRKTSIEPALFARSATPSAIYEVSKTGSESRRVRRCRPTLGNPSFLILLFVVEVAHPYLVWRFI